MSHHRRSGRAGRTRGNFGWRPAPKFRGSSRSVPAARTRLSGAAVWTWRVRRFIKNKKESFRSGSGLVRRPRILVRGGGRQENFRLGGTRRRRVVMGRLSGQDSPSTANFSSNVPLLLPIRHSHRSPSRVRAGQAPNGRAARSGSRALRTADDEGPTSCRGGNLGDDVRRPSICSLLCITTTERRWGIDEAVEVWHVGGPWLGQQHRHHSGRATSPSPLGAEWHHRHMRYALRFLSAMP